MSKENTRRVTKFKGLNKATNPHNIDDAELVTLENLFVTKNRGLESRKGYRRLGDVDIASSYYVKSLFTTAWSKTDERLYYVGNGFMAKMDADGADTYVAKIDDWGRTAQFDRYHDKVLFLNENSYLQWFNSDENLELVKYPEMKASETGYGSNIAPIDLGGLEINSHYQYCISLILGDDYLDGESPASKEVPGEGFDKNPPPGPPRLRLGHGTLAGGTHVRPPAVSAKRVRHPALSSAGGLR